MRPSGIKWTIVLLGLSLGMMAGVALDAGPARAESQGRGIELLTRATKSYEAGAYTDAAELVDSAFKAGLTGEYAARAILLRAEINERGGALARALQDYSNALWMESLPQADRKRATEGKERVMAAMGLNSGTPAATRQTSASASGSAAPAPASGSSSGGVFDFFSGIFSSGDSPAASAPGPAQESAQPAPPPAAPPAAKQTAAPKPAKPKQAQPVKAASATKAPPQPASALSVASAPGGFLIIFGSASSEASGRSTAKTIKAQLSDILINRELDVTQKAGGGFQVQAGPYKAKSSALALCSAMKQRGVQCQVTP